jgi:hypothetical protein
VGSFVFQTLFRGVTYKALNKHEHLVFKTHGECYMKLRIAIIAATVMLLAGCATNKDYRLYAETQQKIAHAQAMSDTARYAALAEIAKTADPGARVAAVMSINFGSQGGNGPRVQQVAPPKTFGETALQWTSVLLPSLTNIYGITANRQVAITQSNNAAAVAKSTNDTFATMNGNMATSNTAIANSGLTATTNVANTGIAQVGTTAAAGLTATTTVANTGIAQVGTTAAAGLTAVTAVNASSNTAITSVSDAANASIQAVADVIPQLQPNVTTTTTSTTNNNTVAP